MVNYQNGKIYKLISYVSDKIYVGSTCQSLAKRLSCHKHQPAHKGASSRELTSIGDCDIILIENFPCISKEELHAREAYWIRKLDCINKVIPGRKKQEYRKTEEYKSKAKHWPSNSRESKSECFKKWYDTHQDHIKNRRLSRSICECGNRYRSIDKARHERSKKHKTFLQRISLVKDFENIQKMENSILDEDARENEAYERLMKLSEELVI